MQPPPEDAAGAVEAPSEPFESGSEPGSFDPGVETGYLRRAPREGPPPVELGALPFDPGPGTGFDGRRAKRDRRRREREEQERAEAEKAAEREAERARIEAERAEQRETEERARAEAEEAAEREAEIARLEAAERELEEVEQRAVADAERSRSAAEERERAEREARARAEQDRARAAAARAKEERAAAEGRRRAAAAKASRRAARPRPAPAPAAATTAAPGLARPTAKLTAGLAVVIVGAALLGSVLGLPAPFSGSGAEVAASLSAGPQLGVGTAAALYRGPFHPVLGDYEYGESAGRFHASRGGRLHEGQDIFSKSGTPLVAVRDGVVVDRGKTNGAYSGGRGNYLAIYSPIENRSYVYLHLLKPALVDKGERVHAGQIIGQMGCTGSCDGTHLHFEVRIGKASFAAETKAIDPLPVVKGLPQAPDELTEP